MTQTTQGQQSRPEEVSGGFPVHPLSTTDSASDNDASEKSAREKFKKTSLASLSKHALPSEASPGDEPDPTTTNPTELAGAPLHEENTKEEPRGRAVAKRALEDEDMDFPARENPVAHERLPDPSNGHIRKRSRDVRAGNHVKDDGRFYDAPKKPVQEDDRETANKEKLEMTSQEQPEDSLITGTDDTDTGGIPVHLKFEEGSVLPVAGDKNRAEGDKSAQTLGTEEKRKAEDEEMKDGAYSPRKKRSRDYMDTEADREQKIAATEETRAQRRSDELDRSDMPSHEGTASLRNGSESSATAISTADLSRESKASTTTSNAPKATFGATNMLRPSTGPSRSNSPPKASQNTLGGTKDNQASAPSAFASSGFASFASSSNSPFSVMGASLNAAAPSPSTTAKPPAAENLEPQKPAPEGNGGFGSFAKVPSSGFGTDQQSPFAAAASKTGRTFGGSIFGGGFGSGFGSGSMLTSFAAPTGDAKLGSANGSVKPIGSPSHENEDKDGSESEGAGEEDQSKDDEVSEADDRFQHQDVETGEDGEDTIFSSRAKLYAFKDNNWKEAGNGIFKLNVISSENPEDEQKTSRFIMRAHQTYRVLLNQPIFPQMKVGDRLGNEPTAKAFAFAVIEDGKPIPHMVRVILPIPHNMNCAHADCSSVGRRE